MPSLGLDLGPSETKIARARQHLDTLEREVPAEIVESGPYAVRFSEVDPQTGWCEISLVPQDTEKPRLSVLVGDLVHNLRCALDYIITALADASGTPLTTRHQFPIFNTEGGYSARVTRKKDGPLQGIVHGNTLIDTLQPYKLKPNPRADPLWHIHRFSNADKHREPIAFLAIPHGSFKIRFNGVRVETEEFTEITNWSPNEEYVISRMRFDPPRARNLRVDGPMQLEVIFTTPAFETEPAHSVGLTELRESCDHVAMVIDAFKLL